jgi:hypothetical protein
MFERQLSDPYIYIYLSEKMLMGMGLFRFDKPGRKVYL